MEQPPANGTGDCSINGSVFDNQDYFIVTMLSATTALVSTIACAAVVLLVLVLKKYYFFTQRLILYLSLAALLNSISIVLRFQKIHREDIQGLCIFTAFFDQTTAWSELCAISSITINLLLTVIYRKQTTKLEPLYVFMIFVFPLTINWIPFVNYGYGKAGAWCWIRSQKDDCTSFLFGVVLRYVLWWVPFYVILSILIIIYIVIVYYVRRQRHIWDGNYDPESERLKKMTEKEIRPLMWYPLIFFFINIFPFINRIHDSATDTPQLALWILHAIFSPLQGGFIAVAFTLDKETFRRLNCAQIHAAVWGRKQHCVSEYPATEPKGYTDSLQKKRTVTNGKYSGVGIGGTKVVEEAVEDATTSEDSAL